MEVAPQYPMTERSTSIPKASFRRLAKDHVREHGTTISGVAQTAMDILHEASEQYITEQFIGGHMLAKRSGRDTLQPQDLIDFRRIHDLDLGATE